MKVNLPNNNNNDENNQFVQTNNPVPANGTANQPNTGGNTSMSDKAQEALQNGEVLNVFAQRFCNDRTRENMVGVLSCLRDTHVFVPARVKVDGIDPSELAQKGNPVMLPSKKSIAISPQMLVTSGGDKCIPMYSLKEHIQKDKLNGYPVVNMPYLKVVDMMRSIGKCNNLVLDPFSYNIFLTEKLINLSLKLR